MAKQWQTMGRGQCDQMARLFLKYLALYDNALWPDSIKKVARVDSQFCQLLIKPFKLAKDLKFFA